MEKYDHFMDELEPEEEDYEEDVILIRSRSDVLATVQIAPVLQSHSINIARRSRTRGLYELY